MKDLGQIVTLFQHLNTPLDVAQTLAQTFKKYESYNPEEREAMLHSALQSFKAANITYQPEDAPLFFKLVTVDLIDKFTAGVVIAFTQVKNATDRQYLIETLINLKSRHLTTAQGFAVLFNEHIRPNPENLAHFNAIQNSYHGHEIAKTIAVMQSFHLLQGALSTELYQAVYRIGYAQKISDAFLALADIGLPYSLSTHHLYVTFVKHCDHRALETVHAFSLLIEHGISWNEETEFFYFAHLKNIWNTDTLNACLAYFKHHQVEYKKGNQAIYGFCFDSPMEALARAELMIELLHMTPNKNPKTLCEAAYHNGCHVTYILNAVRMFKTLDIPIENKPIKALQKMIRYTNKEYDQVLSIIVEGHQTNDNHDSFFAIVELMFNSEHCGGKALGLCQWLQSCGFVMTDPAHQHLYEVIFNHTGKMRFKLYHLQWLKTHLEKSTGALHLDWLKSLITAAILGNNTTYLCDHIEYLQSQDIELNEQNLPYYQIACWGGALSIMQQLNFKPGADEHRPIFIRLCQAINNQVHQTIENVISKICLDYLDNQGLSYAGVIDSSLVRHMFNINESDHISSDLINLVERAFQQHLLVYGPCSKNQGTIALEQLLMSLCKQPEDWYTSLHATPSGDELSIDNTRCFIYSLCRHADFSQLELTDETITILGQKMNWLNPTWLQQYVDFKSRSPLLPVVLQYAVHYYTSQDGYYLDFNHFFRTLPQKNATDSLFYLILASLLSVTTNRLSFLLDDDSIYPDEKAVLLKLQTAAVADFRASAENPLPFLEHIKCSNHWQQYLNTATQRGIISAEEAKLCFHRYDELKILFCGGVAVVREEQLTRQVIESRLFASPLRLPQITSTTRSRAWFYKRPGAKYHKTTFPHVRSLGIGLFSSYSDKEQEVLLPIGRTVKYHASDCEHLATIIHSPTHEHNNYWPEHALKHAFKFYLNRPYQDGSDSVTLNGQIIHRPNHGLAHTYRVMLLVPLLIDYFAQHGKNDSFRQFCCLLSQDDIALIQMASVFLVTGREGECYSGDAPQLYAQYCLNSVIQFSNYIHITHPSSQNNQHWLFQLLKFVLAHRGSQVNISDYRHETSDFASASYLYHILIAAHDIDVQRCMDLATFEKVIAKWEQLSEPSQGQQEKWRHIIRYNNALIMAHGDCCLVQFKGLTMHSQNQHYQHPFEQVSLSVNALINISNQVNKPFIPSRLLSHHSLFNTKRKRTDSNASITDDRQKKRAIVTEI